MHVPIPKDVSKSEQGSALVYTLMVLLLLSLLGMSVGMVTVGSYRLASENQDSTSAYYIAEAGATTISKKIEQEVTSIYATSQTETQFYSRIKASVDQNDNKTLTDFQTTDINDSTAHVVIIPNQNNQSEFTIKSTGKVGKRERIVEQTLSINWIEKKSGNGIPTLPELATLIMNGNIEIKNGTFQGGIYTNAQSKGAFKVEGWPTFTNATLHHLNKIPSEQLLIYPKQFGIENRMPTLKVVAEKFNMSGYRDLIEQINEKWKNKTPTSTLNLTRLWSGPFDYLVNQDVSFQKIEVKLDDSFAINTNGKDITIFVNELVLQAPRIVIIGTGKVTFVVKNTLDIKEAVKVNAKGDRNQFNLIYLGESQAVLSEWENSEINGNLIFTRSSLSANSTLIRGIVFVGGNNVSLHGGRKANSEVLLVAPNGKVNLSGSYSIKGNVVGESFEMSGGTNLTYKKIDSSNFPFALENSSSDPDVSDLIISTPIIEPN